MNKMSALKKSNKKNWCIRSKLRAKTFLVRHRGPKPSLLSSLLIQKTKKYRSSKKRRNIKLRFMMKTKWIRATGAWWKEKTLSLPEKLKFHRKGSQWKMCRKSKLMFSIKLCNRNLNIQRKKISILQKNKILILETKQQLDLTNNLVIGASNLTKSKWLPHNSNWVRVSETKIKKVMNLI